MMAITYLYNYENKCKKSLENASFLGVMFLFGAGSRVFLHQVGRPAFMDDRRDDLGFDWCHTAVWQRVPEDLSAL